MCHCVRSSDAFNEFNNLTLSNEMSNYKSCYTRCKIIYERNDFMYHFNLTADIELYGDVMIMNIGDTFRVTITRDPETKQVSYNCSSNMDVSQDFIDAITKQFTNVRQFVEFDTRKEKDDRYEELVDMFR